ncbi:hypothetical protein PYW08_012622 [Mythimna loreyi]|uniref:Uncharacterized protein n=1 Tax=Mythimna loreyi TaxID=667449 RepID=A0ACC2Q2J3_9NEOP|nr:hypothetical protein PYW08_012622 [Mythimna loreyi]
MRSVRTSSQLPGCPRAPKIPAKLAKRTAARQLREAPASIPAPKLPERLASQRPSPWNMLQHQRAFPALATTPKPVPALMATPIPAPPSVPVAPAIAAPKVAPKRLAVPATKQAQPSDCGSDDPVGLTILENYSIFMTSEVRALSAELNAAKRASKLDNSARQSVPQIRLSRKGTRSSPMP